MTIDVSTESGGSTTVVVREGGLEVTARSWTVRGAMRGARANLAMLVDQFDREADAVAPDWRTP